MQPVYVGVSVGMPPPQELLTLKRSFLHSGDISRTFSGCFPVTNSTSNILAIFKQTVL